MHEPFRSLIDIYQLDSLSLSLGLADLKNEHAVHRMRSGEGSSISFITGHLLASRHAVLGYLGQGDENPWHELFGGLAPSRDGSEYPDVSELKAAWDETAQKLMPALEGLSEEAGLAALPADSGIPVADQTVRGAVGFFAFHEAYHVGQVGLLRTELGYSSIQVLVDGHLRMAQAA